jgi:hypothetical protein
MLDEIKIIYESNYLTTRQKINLIKSIREGVVGNVMKVGAGLAAGGAVLGMGARVAAKQKMKVQQLLNTCMQNCKYQFQTTQNKQAFDQCMLICQQRENMLSQQLKSKAGINPGMAQA